MSSLVGWEGGREGGGRGGGREGREGGKGGKGGHILSKHSGACVRYF